MQKVSVRVVSLFFHLLIIFLYLNYLSDITLNKMKHFIRLFFLLLSFSQTLYAFTPDTVTNRYATAEDANFWSSVNEGDYIFFKGNVANGRAIHAGGTVFHVKLSLGKKILLWRYNYRSIFIDGKFCESTEAQPTVITNLGGQVKWGYSEEKNNSRGLKITGFQHLYLTGKYDEAQQTGDANFLGHNAGKDFDKGNYHERYGLWGNPRWSGYRFNGSFTNIVRIEGFKTCKVSYVATTEGGFAGFNIKSDNPANPKRVDINIQDCFAGWTESEGYYISYSTSAKGQDLTKLTFRNNIAVFCGTESFQTDNLVEGSVLENNIAFAGACFFRRPFQDRFQDGLHQFSFVEGGVTVQNNIMITGNSLHQIRYKDAGAGRAFPAANKKVLFKNNYYGYARSSISYVWEGDGITPYEIDGNIYGPVSTPSTRDAYNGTQNGSDYIKVCNVKNNITFKNIMSPGDRPLYRKTDCGTSKIDSSKLTTGAAPLIEFVNAGFDVNTDYRKITFWSADYQTTDKKGQFIPYKQGDYVFYFDNTGKTKFYKCLQNHSGNFDPNTSPTYWEVITWNGRNLPPLDLRVKTKTFYEERGIGLTYNKDVVSALTSPKSTGEERLLVYPNPSKGLVTLQLPQRFKLQKGSTLQLIDIYGKVILSQAIQTNFPQLNVAGLAKGYYFLVVSNTQQNLRAKLIVK